MHVRAVTGALVKGLMLEKIVFDGTGQPPRTARRKHLALEQWRTKVRYLPCHSQAAGDWACWPQSGTLVSS
jgi:hypothetical protein